MEAYEATIARSRSCSGCPTVIKAYTKKAYIVRGKGIFCDKVCYRVKHGWNIEDSTPMTAQERQHIVAGLRVLNLLLHGPRDARERLIEESLKGNLYPHTAMLDKESIYQLSVKIDRQAVDKPFHFEK